MIKFAIITVLLSALLTATSAGQPLDAGCEPGGDLNVAAHRVSISEEGDTARVTVDLKIYAASHAVRSVVIDGRIVSRGAERAIHSRQAGLPADRNSKARFTFDLERGILHELKFQVHSANDPTVRSSTTLRVDLDPAHQPLRLDGVVQYRAQMQGDTQ